MELISAVLAVAPNRSYDKALQSLKRADYPKKCLELLVVKGKQPAKQRNMGVKKAKGKIIYFLDDDVVLDKNLFKNLMKYYKKKDVAVVGGPNLTPASDSFLQKCFGYVMESSFGTGEMKKRYKAEGNARPATEKDLILCNLSVKKKVIEREGGFNELLYPNEENELFNRLTKKGYELWYAPDVIVFHSRRQDLLSFAKQNFNYGRGRAEQTKIQPSSLKPMFLAPSIFTLYLVSLPFLSTVFYLPLFFYALAAVGASVSKAAEEKKTFLIFVLPFLFMVLHLTYGTGFIYGLLKPFKSKEFSKTKITIKRVAL